MNLLILVFIITALAGSILMTSRRTGIELGKKGWGMAGHMSWPFIVAAWLFFCLSCGSVIAAWLKSL